MEKYEYVSKRVAVRKVQYFLDTWKTALFYMKQTFTSTEKCVGYECILYAIATIYTDIKIFKWNLCLQSYYTIIYFSTMFASKLWMESNSC